MELSTLISLITIIVTWVLGKISKKHTKLNNKLIPIQNILVGLIVALIEWIVTKDFKVAIALSGIIAGGTYDIFHNLEKLIKGE
jgi:Na+/glutamate symporter